MLEGEVSALQDERQKLAARMTPKAARLLLDLPLLRVRRLEEMRFYAGQNACFIFDGRSETQHAFFSRQDVDELVTALCGYSRYAYETQLAQGFIPLEGGCRAGVCGRVTRDNDGAARLSSPTSVCIRMAREISGASEAVFPFMITCRSSTGSIIGSTSFSMFSIMRVKPLSMQYLRNMSLNLG